MKVLLIRVPAFRHVTENQRSLAPMGLAYVASALIGHGHEVSILDAEVGDHAEDRGRGFRRVGLDDVSINDAVIRFDPDVVGLSCMFANSMPMLHEAAEAVRCDFDGPLYAGGYAPTSDPEGALESVDYVIQGEGEFAFPAHLDGGTSEITEQVWVADLDSYPTPAWHLLDFEQYRRFERPPGFISQRWNGTKAAGVLTSRGCPVGCNFCSVQIVTGKPFRRRSPEAVVEEILYLRDTYGIEKIHFLDDNLTLTKAHALGIFRAMIEAKCGVVWNTTQGTAGWNWDNELLDAAIESGLQYMILPVESGSDEVLRDLMHKKPLKVSKISDAVDRARTRNLGVQGWAIIGTPGETKAQMNQTLRFMNDLDLDYRGAAAATPYPGTDLYRECVEKGYIEEPIDFARLQRMQGCITTREFSARWVTARLGAWTMNGRIRTGQGVWGAFRREVAANGFWMACYAALLALRERCTR